MTYSIASHHAAFRTNQNFLQTQEAFQRSTHPPRVLTSLNVVGLVIGHNPLGPVQHMRDCGRDIDETHGVYIVFV